MRKLSDLAATSRADIEQEIDTLTRALEQLRKRAGHDSHEGFSRLRDRAGRLLHDSLDGWEDTYGELSRTSRELSRAASERVRERPVTSVAIGLGVVALIGWLVSRR
ncbi:Membrane-anchored ribosome-binding protein, inhibits growth in stationary phase, ElaB/YqjD/DUF883 family [Pseudomonas cuatrocienegasensis]|uniref:Membrane-anchored ribosome-binding protein, inhibits growth in stationary phase, ElaB/YqjD/DUF883 family n=1 Tax=Pseudomonas cuatrocienegasensis TaxID=543360 RepID=A0ABY1BHI8_9PSED|nr:MULTISPECIES: DUF883 family protein [Pseudomonas]OEC33031.1 hypothetical protein A7D25_21020 [Pseudomonas sp. 21C1]SEQ88651.1 Membrane-anchored ribosome-binding protein, inhibits growth in stationary phase, ElaB/YqjD/DUF883 family [Pseudomonas cuatrocienegasensis]